MPPTNTPPPNTKKIIRPAPAHKTPPPKQTKPAKKKKYQTLDLSSVTDDIRHAEPSTQKQRESTKALDVAAKSHAPEGTCREAPEKEASVPEAQAQAQALQETDAEGEGEMEKEEMIDGYGDEEDDPYADGSVETGFTQRATRARRDYYSGWNTSKRHR